MDGSHGNYSLPRYASSMHVDIVEVEPLGKRRFEVLRLLLVLLGFACIWMIIVQIFRADQLVARCRIPAALCLMRIWMITVMVHVLTVLSLVLHKENAIPFLIFFHVCLLLAYVFDTVPVDQKVYSECFLKDPRVLVWMALAYSPHMAFAFLLVGAALYVAFKGVIRSSSL